MPRGAHQPTPTISCFSGITVCIKTISDSTIKAPRQLPVKLIVKHKDIGPGDIGFTLIVKPVPMEEVGGLNRGGSLGLELSSSCPIRTR